MHSVGSGSPIQPGPMRLRIEIVDGTSIRTPWIVSSGSETPMQTKVPASAAVNSSRRR